MTHKILWVDDEAHYLSAHVEILEDEGYELKLVSKVGQVIQLLAEQKWDLIILDLMMPPENPEDISKPNYDPRRTGVKLFQAIRRRMQLDIPVIFMSAVRDDKIIQQLCAIERGSVVFLRKPPPINDLIKEVKKSLGGS